MNRSRPLGFVSESYVTTLMPCARALSSAGTTALGSLAEMTIASCFCVVSGLMYDTCDEAVASDGPTRLNVPLTALTASSPPLSEIVKYGLLICFGRNAIFRPDLISPPPAAGVFADDAPDPLDDSLSVLSFVDPHAVTVSMPAATSATRPALLDLNISLLTGFGGT